MLTEVYLTQFYEDLPEKLTEPLWITIGNFDGLHLGHQALISRLRTLAQAQGTQSGMLTFWPHPRVFFKNYDGPFFLTTKSEKQELLKHSGLDLVITLEFNQAFADLSAEAFFDLLTSRLNLKGLVVGENFALGKNRSGTLEVIDQICSERGIQLEVFPRFSLDGEPVSSARIRKALEEGNVEQAARLLGQLYFVRSQVIEGKRLGSKLGFPTANQLALEQKILLKYGVYATYVRWNGERYQGVTSVGVRPTFEERGQPNIETLLLDFAGNIYHEELTVEFAHFIREEIKFENAKELIDQIEQDKILARRLLSDEPYPESLPSQPKSAQR
jgi:riboflavin kinase/FMN adenylyltransferase